MKRAPFILTALALVLAGCTIGHPVGAAPRMAASAPICTGATLSSGFDSENGAFNGMSHSGTLLRLRNLGPGPCRLPALPTVTFLDASHRPLAIVRRMTTGLRSGTVRLAAGAEVTARLRWVSAPVYTHNRCEKVAAARVSWPGGSVEQKLRAEICGPGVGPARFDQSPLDADHVH